MNIRLASGLLSGVALMGAAAAQEPVFRTDVQLVRILATVKDPAGGLVGSLEKTDFSVRDNGVGQEISIFERQTDQPLSVAILIDNSGSTAKDLKFETDSVSRFLRAVLREGNPEDRIALYSFNWQIVKQNNFTRDAAAVDRALKGLRGEAGTALYDAILLASRDIEDRAGRKVMVIVTDGGDTTSRSDFARAVEAAQLADAVIYPVLVVPITNEAGRNIGGENALTTLAQRTGGRVFEPSLGAALDQAFDQILKDLRTQYLIGFYPRNVPLTTNRYHALQVSVTEPELQVKARSGYYGDALKAAASTGNVSVNPDSESVRPPKPKPPAIPASKRAIQTNVAQSKGKSARPPEYTLEEIKYLKYLIEGKIPVCVKLSDNEEIRGFVEYYDQRFIRITREGAPNLFVFKQDIKYLYEVP